MYQYDGLVLYLTLNCNLACTYCFCGKKYKEDMDENMAKRAIDYYMRLPGQNKNLAFFGGEPLLQVKLIDKICTYCNNKYPNKLTYSMTTNGTLLNKENMEIINKYKINILLSLDGLRESHDINRPFYNQKGSWDNIIKNINENFINKPPVRITFSKKTVDKLYDNVIGLHKMGFADIAFYPGDAGDFTKDDMECFKEQFSKVVNYYYECMIDGKLFRTHWIEKVINFAIRDNAESCKPGQHQFSVTPAGKFFPCNRTNFSNDTLCIGDIDNGLDYTKIDYLAEESSKIDPECIDCELLNRCSKCPIQFFETNNTFYIKPDWYCEMEKYVIICADKMANKLFAEKNMMFSKIFYQGSDIYKVV